MGRPPRFDNVTEALYFEAKNLTGSRGITFLGRDEGEEEHLTYLEVYERARRTAAGLAMLGVEPGEAVLQIIPTGPAFLDVFFGTMLVGATPCPVSSPMGFGTKSRFVKRVRQLAEATKATHVICDAVFADLARSGLDESVQVVSPESIPEGTREIGRTRSSIEAPAYIQFTSGSTTIPKGTILSHGAASANVYQIGWALNVKESDVVGTWLPLYHDMGLIGCLLFAIYWNLDAVFTDPFQFLRRPGTWLRMISNYECTLSPAPAFAYGYAVKRIDDEELEGVDLSSWRTAFCGAEPIRADMLRAFIDRFSEWGLPETTPFCCYGLAEAGLAVTFQPVEERFSSLEISRSVLAEEGRVAEPSGERDVLEVVSCGHPLREIELTIRDDKGRELPEERVGEVVLRGPSLFDGYLGRPEETAKVLKDGDLYTGDLGFLKDGELYITGRKKDIIIIRGQNFFPTDFEWAAASVKGIRTGSVAAIGVQDPETGTDVLVIAAETKVTDGDELQALESEVRKVVNERTGVPPARVILLPPRSIPKTTSGKVQRPLVKRIFLEKAEEGVI